MIGLDTNVIVRYIVQDDKAQSAIATRIFEKDITRENKGFITSIALCETLWVLGRGYKQPKEKLLQVVAALLEVDNIELECRDCVWNAYCDWEEGKSEDVETIKRGYEKRTTFTTPLLCGDCGCAPRLLADRAQFAAVGT